MCAAGSRTTLTTRLCGAQAKRSSRSRSRSASPAKSTDGAAAKASGSADAGSDSGSQAKSGAGSASVKEEEQEDGTSLHVANLSRFALACPIALPTVQALLLRFFARPNSVDDARPCPLAAPTHHRNVTEGHVAEIFGKFGRVAKVELGMDKRVNLPKVRGRRRDVVACPGSL